MQEVPLVAILHNYSLTVLLCVHTFGEYKTLLPARHIQSHYHSRQIEPNFFYAIFTLTPPANLYIFLICSLSLSLSLSHILFDALLAYKRHDDKSSRKENEADTNTNNHRSNFNDSNTYHLWVTKWLCSIERDSGFYYLRQNVCECDGMDKSTIHGNPSNYKQDWNSKLIGRRITQPLTYPSPLNWHNRNVNLTTTRISTMVI